MIIEFGTRSPVPSSKVTKTSKVTRDTKSMKSKGTTNKRSNNHYFNTLTVKNGEIEEPIEDEKSLELSPSLASFRTRHKIDYETMDLVQKKVRAKSSKPGGRYN
jgi:hypothetical protein